ncbi:aspartate decarboxylase [Desulforamulus aquiferis]|nr:aspartate 1-decarboxylase [Desulforamulus aquiferis]RYD02833.1 aspartate decarboxylase [Desulforamulus aquiferis]
MLLFMFKSKIHRATVTEANLNYMGSITIDRELMKAAGILPNEKVQVVNNNNGARLETYVIEGEPETGVICLNGAAARLVQPGDQVIIIAYTMIDEKEAASFKPKVVMVDEQNKITKIIANEVQGMTG